MWCFRPRCVAPRRVVMHCLTWDRKLDMAIFALLKRLLRPGARVVCFKVLKVFSTFFFSPSYFKKNCFPRLRVGENHYLSRDHPLAGFHLPPHQFMCMECFFSFFGCLFPPQPIRSMFLGLLLRFAILCTVWCHQVHSKHASCPLHLIPVCFFCSARVAVSRHTWQHSRAAQFAGPRPGNA